MERNDEQLATRTRAQLLAAGVPPWKQTREGLLGLFPPELNVSATGLDAPDLAEVLLYLVARGLVTLSATAAGSSIKKVEPGWHFCQFYRNDAQLLEMIAPFVAEGLTNDDGCFWVLPMTTSVDAACDALARSVQDVGGYLANGRLEFGFHADWYLDPSGRLKSFEEISGALLAKQNQTLSKGLQSLRAAGDAGWVSGVEQSKSFIDYEMKVNDALKSTTVAAVCTFRAAVTADELVDIVTAHQNAFHRAELP